VSETGRGPGVRWPPPLLFAAAFFLGWLLDRYVVHLWPVLPLRTSYRIDVLGWTLVLTGLTLAYWGIATFLRLRTPIYPNRDAKRLVIAGPYRFSRNPMYTGMIIAYAGGCAVVNSLWPLALLPFAVAALYRLVIRNEERYLTEAFGDEYREYQGQVGRWFTF
jgi:protein-S-isoprenylcysteine O-methyltransferase Ste14